MEQKNSVAIIIVTYNQSSIILKQIQCIQRFCKDERYNIVIVDNSDNPEDILSIQHHATEQRCEYMKTVSTSKNGSSSHSFAANLAYEKFGRNYKACFFIDHDCFPVKDFSVEKIIEGKLMAGIGQLKNGKTYFWPGCLMFKPVIGIIDDIDFSPNHEFGLDTGGNNYKIIEKHDISLFGHFDEVYCENDGFTKNKSNFYSMIMDGTFMHFIAGSNWKGEANHEERINSLINILDSKIK